LNATYYNKYKVSGTLNVKVKFFTEMVNKKIYKYVSLFCAFISFLLLSLLLIDFDKYGHLSTFFMVFALLVTLFASLYRKGLNDLSNNEI
jgi:hypothetical protein